MAEPTLRQNQTFPVYYPGEGVFTNDGTTSGTPSGLVGAKATVKITINTRPHGFTGVRIRNVFPVPAGPLNAIAATYFPSWADLHGLDIDQDVNFNLAQQNVVMERADQAGVVGGGIGGSYVWHPFACPYPFRGGNNVQLVLTRTTSYPLILDAQGQLVEGIFPVAKVVLVGYAYVSGQKETGSPPSSGWPE